MTNQKVNVNEILRLKRVERMPVREIAAQLHETPLTVWEVCKYGNDVSWLRGLSNRAVLAALKTPARTLDELIELNNNKLYDFEDLEGVGHKTALELINWCNMSKHKSNR